ncbi:nucleotidyltransferase [Brevibacillus daliensis]|uniref:nucleotidyltransferase n=1 Tax=Brevibacillus daliensis TaxID=2892995 RepID=UPI001E61EF37|nr:nucleotidyltransferase [Brevibacillus daliensis]
MKTVGLIVEYNPLHNGHKLHYERAKETAQADASIAVMSGNFLQRGEPAIVSKWARTEMALSLGIDLVIELPVPFATANAELFAHGAVSILDRLGVVDAVCFGSESGDIDWMIQAARLLAHEPPAFSAILKEGLDIGLPYPKAYAQAAASYLGTQGINDVALDQPNNILGFNYLLSLARLNSQMSPLTIRREKAGYHQSSITDEQIASATALRKILNEQGHSPEALRDYVPPGTLQILQDEKSLGREPITWEHFTTPLFHLLLRHSPKELAAFHEVEEGIEYRIKQAALHSTSVEQLLQQAKTKRFTHNRLQRILLNLLLGITKQQIASFQLKQGAPYARILGFSPVGRELLQQSKKNGSIPLFTNVRDGMHPMLDLDIKANAIYRLTQRNSLSEPFHEEYRRFPMQHSVPQSST